MIIKAKFKCDGIREEEAYKYRTIYLPPVTSGSEENKSFAKYTPSGQIQMNISEDTLAYDFFEQGKEYYIDFSKAE